MTEQNYVDMRTVGRDWLTAQLDFIDDAIAKVEGHLIVKNANGGYTQAVTTARALRLFIVEQHAVLVFKMFDQ